MPSITFIHSDGREESLDVPVGTTIMHAAVAAGIDGIVGECGVCNVRDLPRLCFG
ncbi:hypothetical protein ACF1BQ_019780 [Bradyrhizobium sp. RDT10]